MADQKLTALTEDTAPAATDYAYTVKDPGGSPLSRRSTWLNVLKGQILGLLTSDNDIIARVGGVATRIPVAASTFLGRKASGDVTAMTVTEARALVGGQFKQTIYTGTTNPSSSSTSFVDIDATLYPALSLTLAVGDVVQLEFQASFKGSATGRVWGVDWLIDQPTSADTTIRASGSKAAAWLHEWPDLGNDVLTLTPRAWFVCTEAGVHTFKPQWRMFTVTVTINNTDANYFTASYHRVTNLGPVTA